MFSVGQEAPHCRSPLRRGFYPSPTCLSFALPYVGRLTPFRCGQTRKRHTAALGMTESASHAKTLSRPSVIFITPDNACQNIRETVRLAKAVLTGGISLVQVRDSNGTLSQMKQLIQALLAAGVPAHVLVINGMDPSDVMAVNWRLGVHIKERDIGRQLPKAKKVMAPESVIGCAVHSTHTAKQAVSIHEPSYLQVGTMYSTQSHPGKIPEGPKLVTQIRCLVGKSTRLIGVGGISEDNIASVIEHGADGIAVITQLSNASDPQMKCASLLKLCKTAYQAKKRE